MDFIKRKELCLAYKDNGELKEENILTDKNIEHMKKLKHYGELVFLNIYVQNLYCVI